VIQNISIIIIFFVWKIITKIVFCYNIPRRSFFSPFLDPDSSQDVSIVYEFLAQDERLNLGMSYKKMRLWIFNKNWVILNVKLKRKLKKFCNTRNAWTKIQAHQQEIQVHGQEYQAIG